MSKRFGNYINGKFIDAVSGETFENRNPSDFEEVIGLFPRSLKEDVDNAVSAASAAFKNWKSMPPAERGNILYEAGRIMASRKKELAEVISEENGKTVTKTLNKNQVVLVKKAIKEMKEISLVIDNWKKTSLKEIEKTN